MAVFGLPNAGKSTLVNTLVGQKISIVCRKAQTTRNRVLGIALHHQTQIVLMDTPGVVVHLHQARLNKSMTDAALSAPADADLCLFVIDVNTPQARQEPLLEKLRQTTTPIWVILNKIDQVPKTELFTWASWVGAHLPTCARVFMIAADRADGTGDLLEALAGAMPEGPWLFPEDQVATAPQRMLAAEVTREVLLHYLHQEVPYHLYVETESWETFKNGSVKISQLIHVTKNSHKPIVLGAKGQTIKKISMEARTQLQDVLQLPVHLFLNVLVTPDWMEKTAFYKMMGLTPPAST